jgi:transcription factor SPN1
MSDNEDLFADSDSDSDDTAELVAASKKSTSGAPAAACKKPPPKKVVTAKQKAPSSAAKPSDSDDDDDSSDDDDGGGLFDSDSDDDDDDDNPKASKKPKAKKAAAAPQPKAPQLSKKERLEALAKRNQRKNDTPSKSSTSEGRSKKDGAASDGKGKGSAAAKGGERAAGYESGDSYDSANMERTADDDDFLDTAGEDPDAVNELYAEQHFDDERPDRTGPHKGKKRKVNYDGDNSYGQPGGGGGGGEGGGGPTEPDNPIMAAVHRMKKKKRDKKTLTEMEEEVRMFLGKMEVAAERDEEAFREKRPGLQKLSNLNEMVEMLTRKESQRLLLDLDVLVVCKRWIQPLPNGQLGNLTVRSRILDAVGNMTGESGITPADLKRSEFGKVVMALFKHSQETPQLKTKLRALIEQWSRPIFQKSGNMRDLERAQYNRADRGMAGLARQQQQQQQQQGAARGRAAAAAAASAGGGSDDLHGLISGGKKAAAESGTQRVSVPFSRGFAFSVRPEGRAGTGGDEPSSPEKRGGSGASADTRDKLSKRMVEKGRAVGKVQRSANISIEGRPTKG